MRQFFVNEINEVMLLTADEAWHAVRVLRLKPGSEIEVVSSDGQAARALITGVAGERVELKLLEAVERSSEPAIRITLAQGLAKGDKFDYIVQKAVELGVSDIIPLVSQHCVVKYDAAKQQQRLVRWQKIAAEAAKQCHRTIIPVVQEFTHFDKLLTNLTAFQTTLFFYEQEDQLGVKQILRQSAKGPFLLIVGPEGGFSQLEASGARERGAHVVSLGPRILRTETAATTALTIVLYECGDLGGPLCQK